VIALAERHGPAYARNRGAELARGDILFFVDADVVLAADATAQVRDAFREDPQLAAVFGSYDDAPAATNFLSRYKNLLHHHVHQTSRADASTFWAGCGAIRAAMLARAGGFDESFRRPSIEDIELGRRLRRAGSGNARMLCPYSPSYHLVGYSKRAANAIGRRVGLRLVRFARERDFEWWHVLRRNTRSRLRYVHAAAAFAANALGLGTNLEVAMRRDPSSARRRLGW